MSGSADQTTKITVHFYALQNDTFEERTTNIEVTSGGITKVVKVTQGFVEDRINATPTTPKDNKGTIDLSLEIPSDKSLTGVFTVNMPNGMKLDKANTELAPELQGNHSLSIYDITDGVWQLEINPKVSTRSASSTTYRKVVEIAYIIEDNVENGNYNVIISNLDITMEDNTKIKEDEIEVVVSYSSVGNAFMENAVKVTCFNNTLSVISQHKEVVEIYSIVGMCIFSQQKPEGEVVCNISNIPDGVLIIRGSSGWVRKVLKK